MLERYRDQASNNVQVQRIRSVQRRAEMMLNRDRSSRGRLWKSVAIAMQYKGTAKKFEGKESGMLAYN